MPHTHHTHTATSYLWTHWYLAFCIIIIMSEQNSTDTRFVLCLVGHSFGRPSIRFCFVLISFSCFRCVNNDILKPIHHLYENKSVFGFSFLSSGIVCTVCQFTSTIFGTIWKRSFFFLQAVAHWIRSEHTDGARESFIKWTNLLSMIGDGSIHVAPKMKTHVIWSSTLDTLFYVSFSAFSAEHQTLIGWQNPCSEFLSVRFLLSETAIWLFWEVTQ